MIRLIFAALALPVVMVVVGGTAALLSRMRDALGAQVLGYIALAVGLLWVVCLVALVVVHAVRSIEREQNDEPPPNE